MEILAYCLLPVLMVLLIFYLTSLFRQDEKLPEHKPEWEVVPAKDAGEVVGYQIRWSIPDGEGRFLWVGHYYSGPDAPLQWCEVAAESHCKRLNHQGKQPWEFDAFHHPMST